MRHGWMLPLLPLLAALVAGCGPAATPAAKPELTLAHAAAIGDSVDAMLDSLRAAFGRRDLAASVAFYADDPRFRWVEDGRVRYASRAQMEEALALMSRLRALDLSFYDPIVTAVAPGVATLITNFAQKVVDSTGTARGFAGVMTATVIHQAGGWRLLVGHTSATPAPAADPASSGSHPVQSETSRRK